MATNAMGLPDGLCVMCSTERLLAVKTSKPGSFTAWGFTMPHTKVNISHHFVRRKERGRTCVVLPRDVDSVPDNGVDGVVEAVVVCRCEAANMGVRYGVDED